VDPALVDSVLVFEVGEVVDVGAVPVDEAFWIWVVSIYYYIMKTC
jgi:hypothetical protein